LQTGEEDRKNEHNAATFSSLQHPVLRPVKTRSIGQKLGEKGTSFLSAVQCEKRGEKGTSFLSAVQCARAGQYPLGISSSLWSSCLVLSLPFPTSRDRCLFWNPRTRI
jgi:hypothetical protein